MVFHSHHGQAAITDLFVAISIFIILVTITTLTWDLYKIRLDNRLSYDDMVLKSFQISDTLVKSFGSPDNWETNPQQVQTIGLIETEKVLSKAKVDAFVQQLNYSFIKDLFNINLYDFYFTLNAPNGTVLVTKGLSPQGKYNVNLARVIVYQNQPTTMEFSLWK